MKLFQIDYQGNLTQIEGEIIDTHHVRIDGRKTKVDCNWRAIRPTKKDAWDWYLTEQKKLVSKAKNNLREKERQLSRAVRLAQREAVR